MLLRSCFRSLILSDGRDKEGGGRGLSDVGMFFMCDRFKVCVLPTLGRDYFRTD